MNSNDFMYYPDGLTEPVIDALIAEAFESADQAAEPTTALLDGTAARRRARRITHQTVTAVVRALPTQPPMSGPEAA